MKKKMNKKEDEIIEECKYGNSNFSKKYLNYFNMCQEIFKYLLEILLRYWYCLINILVK